MFEKDITKYDVFRTTHRQTFIFKRLFRQKVLATASHSCTRRRSVPHRAISSADAGSVLTVYSRSPAGVISRASTRVTALSRSPRAVRARPQKVKRRKRRWRGKIGWLSLAGFDTKESSYGSVVRIRRIWC